MASESMTLHLSGTELHFLAADIEAKIAWLDTEYQRLFLDTADPMVEFFLTEEMETNRMVRAIYDAMRIKARQQLDLPFAEEAVAV